ncbi:MAG: hypothetical protein FI719_00260 [SAR202 cluster bacterium]|nr:hypothetical protein [SAR202 cluster bacterium]|tara:strand:- start:11976 stop:12446 length:471 start_codon:yes stop_codon:yes gene_type:complete
MLKLRLFALISLLLIVVGSACADTNTESAEIPVEAQAGTSIFHADRTFTTDSFVAAGWKKSKEYDTATVPESTEIWYGFFEQKDIEIRFYQSHDSALEHGVPLAQESLQMDPGARIGGVNTVRTGYSAYAVVGNVVMMCELDLSSCETLIKALEAS